MPQNYCAISQCQNDLHPFLNRRTFAEHQSIEIQNLGGVKRKTYKEFSLVALTKEFEESIDSLFLTFNIEQKQAVIELKCQNGVRYFCFFF